MTASPPLLETLDLLVMLQRERGLALLTPTQREILQNDRPFDLQADATYETLARAQKGNPDFWVVLPDRFFDAFANRNNSAFRERLSQRELIDWYGYNLEHPIQQLLLAGLTTTPHISPAQTSALIHFIASLGYLCQVRDTGTLVYAHAEMTPKDIRRLRDAALSYLSRERLFLSLADEKLKRIMDEAKGLPVAALGHMHEILRNIRSGQAKSVLADIPFQNWITIMGEEHSALHSALSSSISDLTEEGFDLAAQSTLNQALDQDVELAFPAIGTLPLFRGLSDMTLRTLLKGARILDLERNTLFMRQGEPVSRLFILMDGWVKAYKTNADGQEAILQILGRKEPLLDSGLLQNSPSGLNARTVTKSKILSLSLSVLRDHASRNRELAQNMLAATQSRLGRLVSQYEQLTLQNAMQRVGFFLVNLYLETGLEGEPLQLPFDKALIAAYLNIKPETFSRILKEFRNQGFVIRKHQIELPHPHALCDFCDPDMAVRCCRAEAANCAPIQAARKMMQRA